MELPDEVIPPEHLARWRTLRISLPVFPIHGWMYGLWVEWDYTFDYAPLVVLWRWLRWKLRR